jgi:hypothetical protein
VPVDESDRPDLVAVAVEDGGLDVLHEFKPQSQADLRQLLREGWGRAGVSLCDDSLIDEEALVMLIRIAEGRSRVLHRLLTQIGRVMEANRMDRVTSPDVEAARESLVIGTA